MRFVTEGAVLAKLLQIHLQRMQKQNEAIELAAEKFNADGAELKLLMSSITFDDLCEMVVNESVRIDGEG